MKVGDLVRQREQFNIPDQAWGVVVEVRQHYADAESALIGLCARVCWSSGILWHLINTLEIVSESR